MKYLGLFRIEIIVKSMIKIIMLTAGMSNVPFASQVKLIANVAYNIEPQRLIISLNLVFNRRYNPMFPIMANAPVTIKIPNLPLIPKLINRDVKKQMTGDK